MYSNTIARLVPRQRDPASSAAFAATALYTSRSILFYIILYYIILCKYNARLVPRQRDPASPAATDLHLALDGAAAAGAWLRCLYAAAHPHYMFIYL